MAEDSEPCYGRINHIDYEKRSDQDKTMRIGYHPAVPKSKIGARNPVLLILFKISDSICQIDYVPVEGAYGRQEPGISARKQPPESKHPHGSKRYNVYAAYLQEYPSCMSAESLRHRACRFLIQHPAHSGVEITAPYAIPGIKGVDVNFDVMETSTQ